MLLFGKTIIVTGVASGIGRRTAELAAQMGASVIGIDVVEPQQTTCDFIRGDIGSLDGVGDIVARLPDRVDALCNVAGVSGSGGAASTLAINFYGLRALALGLAGKIREGGSIVNVASIAGYGWRANLDRARRLTSIPGFPDVAAACAENGVPNEEGYPISKEALLLWTMQAAHLPAFKSRGIRVNAVSPGPVDTPILTQFRQVLGDARVNKDIDAVGRAGAPNDIAPVALFLCSDAARWINGVNIPVDGGLEAAVNAEVLGF
jgi:NAD(P)-dependent dehydrogenase (short-subunit alcohol dehydrogenase family)